MPEKTPPLAYTIRQRTETLVAQIDDDPDEIAVRAAAPLLARAARQIATADDPEATVEQLFSWPLQTAHLGVLVAELALIAPDRVPLVRDAAARTQAQVGYGLLRRIARTSRSATSSSTSDPTFPDTLSDVRRWSTGACSFISTSLTGDPTVR